MCGFSAAGVRLEYMFIVFVHLGVCPEPPEPQNLCVCRVKNWR